MQSRWNDAEAQEFITRYAPKGVNADLAVRTYTTRLLGSDPRLVLHGGGNTSVKTVMKDGLGDDVEVLCVKGSGWDMGAIEPQGLPAVRLAPLRRLRARAALTDEDMVAFQRANLLDPAAPNPSVETLLHAFLPHKFIDHTHSTAVLSLADQPNGGALCAETYGERMGLVPYIMPGFPLAKRVAEIYEEDPKVDGVILGKHGIFTFAEDARGAYERMIEMVSRAEERLRVGRKAVFGAGALPNRIAGLADIAPILRGACSLPDAAVEGAFHRFVLEHRGGDRIRNYVNGSEVARYSREGVVTPDHTIRTKNFPLLVPPPDAAHLDDFARQARAAVAAFIADYQAYFTRNNVGRTPPKRALDPLPRVILVPGLRLFGLGRTLKDAKVAADIAENALQTITDAEAIGRFESLPESELFEMEYWSLEQAKLGKSA